jgi:hypothetical protein
VHEGPQSVPFSFIPFSNAFSRLMKGNSLTLLASNSQKVITLKCLLLRQQQQPKQKEATRGEE